MNLDMILTIALGIVLGFLFLRYGGAILAVLIALSLVAGLVVLIVALAGADARNHRWQMERAAARAGIPYYGNTNAVLTGSPRE